MSILDTLAFWRRPALPLPMAREAQGSDLTGKGSELPGKGSELPGKPSDLPRGLRNNNPLNIEHRPSNAWRGLDLPPSDGRFCRFVSMEYGCRAGALLLRTHWQRGARTADALIRIWAPPGENDTTAYVRAVEKSAGLKPGQALDLDSPAVLAALITAMARVENGRDAPAEAIRAGVALAMGSAA